MKESDYATLTTVNDMILGWGIDERVKGSLSEYLFELIIPIFTEFGYYYWQSQSHSNFRVKKQKEASLYGLKVMAKHIMTFSWILC